MQIIFIDDAENCKDYQPTVDVRVRVQVWSSGANIMTG
jgi:hypothetical protein